MKGKVGFIVAVAFVVILTIFQAQYKDYYTLEQGGYAVPDGDIESILYTESGQMPESDIVELCGFSDSDEIYTRASKYYLGEDSKTSIDLDFPMYVNGGAGIAFIDDKGTLIADDFEETAVFDRLTVEGGTTYLADGSQADGAAFIFYKTPSGFFYNVQEMQFEDNGKMRTIPENSIINFDSYSINFLQYVDGSLQYQASTSIDGDSDVEIGGNSLSYLELLQKLGLSSASRTIQQANLDAADAKEAAEEAALAEAEELESAASTSDDKDSDSLDEESSDSSKSKDKSGTNKKSTSKKDSTSSSSSSKSSSSSSSSNKSSGSSKSTSSASTSTTGDNSSGGSNASRGVRPDSARPDKNVSDKVSVKEYADPTVKLETDKISGKIYTITVPYKASDPAGRLDRKGIVVEVYSYSKNALTGEITTSLVVRDYGRASATSIVFGDGYIQPDTDYYVYAYYAYKDKYDEKVSVPLTTDYLVVDGETTNILGVAVKTKAVNSDAVIYLKSGSSVTTLKDGSSSTINYLDIPYYWGDRMVLKNLGVDMDASDTEMLEGVKGTTGGIVLTVKKTSGLLHPTKTLNLDKTYIDTFKAGSLIDSITSTEDLDSNSSYTYEIQIQDYWGNSIKLQIVNTDDAHYNTENGIGGTFMTSKDAPVGSLTLKTNTLGKVEVTMNVTDSHQALVGMDSAGTITKSPTYSDDGDDTNDADLGIYMVFSTKEIDEFGTSENPNNMVDFWNQVNERLNSSEYPTSKDKIHFAKKLTNEDIDYSSGSPKVSNITVDAGKVLQPVTKYHVYLFVNYDLNNGYGTCGSFNTAASKYQSEEMGLISEMEFTTVSLGTLGKVEVSASITDVTSESATLSLAVNGTTNKDLRRIMKSISVSVYNEQDATDTPLIGIEGADADTLTDTTEFTDTEVINFAGKTTDENGETIASNEAIVAVTRKITNLQSINNYRISISITGLYNGEESAEVINDISAKYIASTSFTTKQKSAYLKYKNELLAGGTLYMDALIVDPESSRVASTGYHYGAITGDTYDTVFVEVYDTETGGNPVYTTTMKKSASEDETYTELKVTGLDASKKYYIQFYVKTYSEEPVAQAGKADAVGSKKIIDTYKFNKPINITGTIYLNKIDAVDSSDENSAMAAELAIDITDKDGVLKNSKYLSEGQNALPYYLKVTLNRGEIDTKEHEIGSEEGYESEYFKSPVTVPSILDDETGYTYASTNKGDDASISESRTFYIEKGQLNTYKFYLYIIIAGRRIDLNYTSFKSADIIHTIAPQSGRDMVDIFIEMVQKYPSGKFVITSDIDFGQTNVATKEGKNKYAILSEFNGSIDFQGHTIHIDKCQTNASGETRQGIFNTLGQNSEICNLVFDISTYNIKQTNWYPYAEGYLCQTNYGSIHDIYVEYHGGQEMYANGVGLITQVNATSGSISNFVVNNMYDDSKAVDAQGNKAYPFTGMYGSGLVCATNYGTISDGYVYGKNIVLLAMSGTYGTNRKYTQPGNGAVGSGGIVGNVYGTSRISNVYSLVNVSLPDPNDSITVTKKWCGYGAIVGTTSNSANGTISNCYSVGTADYFNYSTYTNSTTWLQSGGIKDSLGNYYPTGTDVSWNTPGPTVSAKNFKRHSDVYVYNPDSYNGNSTVQSTATLENIYDAYWQSSILGSSFDTSIVMNEQCYPHIIWDSSDMPEQDNISLPKGTISKFSLSAITVNEDTYDEDNSTCEIEVKILNKDRYIVRSITVDGIGEISVTADDQEYDPVTQYTTLTTKLSNPNKFLSTYKLTSISYSKTNTSNIMAYTCDGEIEVAFYRKIRTAKEWTKYVHADGTQNYRIDADIDMSGMSYSDMVVASLSGNIKGGVRPETDEEYSEFKYYGLKNVTIKPATNKTQYANLINEITVAGSLSHLYIENLTITNLKTNRDRNGLVGYNRGDIDDVHILGADITGTTSIGSLVAYGDVNSYVKNCSASDVTIVYSEVNNTATTAVVGGLIGKIDNAYVYNCYTQGIDITVEEATAATGVGGVIGYSYYGQINTISAEGTITARCQNVGGIIGQHGANSSQNYVTNLVAKVNITTKQNSAGGLVGQYSAASKSANTATNFTGIAYGNVICQDTSADEISYTVGKYTTSYYSKVYGSVYQTLNKYGEVQTGLENDSHTMGLLSHKLMTKPETYFSEDYMDMDDVYDYSVVEQGYMPQMYYRDSTVDKLPFQELHYFVTAEHADPASTFTLISSDANTENHTILLNFYGPKNAIITDVAIEDLVTYDADDVSYDGPGTTDDTGHFSLLVRYNNNEVKHFKDAYMLSHVYYKENRSSTEIEDMDLTNNSYLIGLKLYGTIASISDWKKYINRNNNYGNYENYEITAKELDFSNIYASNMNACIGSLKGSNSTDYVVIKNVNITTNKTNLINRLNTAMDNIKFQDCNIKYTSGSAANNNGLIGSSFATITNCAFENITIDATSFPSYSNVGVIGYQGAGSIGQLDEAYDSTKDTHATPYDGRIVVNKIYIKAPNNNSVGGIVGYNAESTKFINIYGTAINVEGRSYVGGICGYSNVGKFEHIYLDGGEVNETDEDDTSTYIYIHGTSYIGGVCGYCYNYSNGSCITLANASDFVDISATGTRYGNNTDYYNNDSGVTAGTKRTIKDKSTYMVKMDSNNNNRSSGNGCVGGIVGQINGGYIGLCANDNSIGATGATEAQIKFYYENADLGALTVDGIAVHGIGHYVGGIAGTMSGTSNNAAYSLVVTNSFIGNTVAENEIRKNYNSAAAISYIGAIAGSCSYYQPGYGNQSINNDVCAINTNYVGGAYGYISNYYRSLLVENCMVLTQNTLTADTKSVGGIAGYAVYATGGVMARNNIVDSANNCFDGSSPTNHTKYTGGGIGESGTGTVYQVQCWGDLGSGTAADPKYYVRGYDYVGGVQGYGILVGCCESNLNVIALHYGAGGIVGYMGIYNGYYYSVYRNMFDGTITAADYAGGLLGAMTGANYTDTTYTFTTDAAGRLYMNMLFAESIKTTEGDHAFAYCGTYDGLEGKANYYSQSNYPGDKSTSSQASRTLMFEGTKLYTKSYPAGLALYELRTDETNRLYKSLSTEGSSYGVTVPDTAVNGADTSYNYGTYFKDSRGLLKKTDPTDKDSSTLDYSYYRFMLLNGGYTDCDFGTAGSYTEGEEYTWKCGAYAEVQCEYLCVNANVRLVSTDQLKKYAACYYAVRIDSTGQNRDYMGQYKKYTKATATRSYKAGTILKTNSTGGDCYNTSYYVYPCFIMMNNYTTDESSSDYWAKSYAYYTTTLPALWNGNVINTSKSSRSRWNLNYYNGTPHLLSLQGSTILTSFNDYKLANNLFEPYPEYDRTAVDLNGINGALPDEIENLGINGSSAIEPDLTVYASDADKINVEVNEGLLNCGYFKLYSGGKEICEMDVTQRVYTFSFDFDDDIRVDYGYKDFETGTEESVLDEKEIFSVYDMTHRVMTYGDSYYYISDEGVIAGKAANEDESSDENYETAEESLIVSGDFVNIMNGRALDTSGNVYDLTSGEQVSSVKGASLLTEVTPLESFTLNGTEMRTFNWCTYSGSDGNWTISDNQTFAGADGTTAIIRSDVENIKDRIHIYSLDGNTHTLVLDTEGHLVDLTSSSIGGAPKDFDDINKGIDDISTCVGSQNTYIACEFKGGSRVVVFDYSTGKYLCDEQLVEVSLLDYLKEFSRGTATSKLGNAFKTYAGTAAVINLVGDTSGLEALVSNNSTAVKGGNGSTDKLVTDMETAEIAKTQSKGTVTGDDTKVRDTSNQATAEDYENSDKSSGTTDSTGEATGDAATAGTTDTSTGEAVADDISNIDFGQVGEMILAEPEVVSVADTFENDNKVTDATETDEEGSDSSDEEGTGDGKDVKASDDVDSSDSKEEGSSEEASAEASSMNFASSGDSLSVETDDLQEVYNPKTGEYDVVSLEAMTSDSTYVSENDRLGIDDLQQYSSYKAINEEDSPLKGVWLYVLVAVAILALVGGTGYYRKKKQSK